MGLDDYVLQDELNCQISESQLEDFWQEYATNFPFDPNNTPSDDDAKNEFIFDLIKRLNHDPNLEFGNEDTMPTC